MTRKRERGSVVGFIVVGVLLTVLVVGGLYTLKQRNFFGLGQKTDDLAQQSTDDAAKNTDDNASKNSPESSSDDTSKADTSKESESSKAEPKPAADKPQPTTPREDSEQAPAGSTNAHANELPATGPSDVILSLVGPAVLVGAFVAYRRSYQL